MSLEKFVGRNFLQSSLNIFQLANLPLLFQLKALEKHYANTSRFFKDERLKAAFTFQNMYLGIKSLRRARHLFPAPIHGTGRRCLVSRWAACMQAIQALVKIAGKAGCEIYLQRASQEDETKKDGKIKSVITEDGREFSADIFVGNADLPYIYKELLPENSRSEETQIDKLYTCSTIMFYWGVDKEYPQIAHHNVFPRRRLQGLIRSNLQRSHTARSAIVLCPCTASD